MVIISAVAVDFVFEMFAIQLPIILGSKFIFWLIYMCIKNPGLVDFAYTFNHFLLGMSLFSMHCINGDSKPILLIILLGIWALRLGGFIFYYRIYRGHKDERYIKIIAKRKNKDLYFLFNHMFQGIVVSLTGSCLYFVFRSTNVVQWNLYLGIILIILGIIGEAIAD